MVGGLVQLPISIDRMAREPMQDQLVEEVRILIRRGAVRPGMRLPASRALSRQLNVSRNTVKNAYLNLMSQGYLQSNGTSGTFVCAILPDEESKSSVGKPKPDVDMPPMSATLRVSLDKKPSSTFDAISFEIRGVNPTLAPQRTWRRLLIKHLPYQSRHAENTNPAGLEALREAVANSISPLRGMSIVADNSIIVSDDYRALDIIIRIVARKNDRVAVEDPCDAGLYYLLRSHGLQVVSVPVDGDGIIPEQLFSKDVQSVFVSPSHQQPTGVTLSNERREQLLSWANDKGAHIVEWDTFGEFRYDESPLPSLFSLNTSDRVIYVNCFSSWIGAGARLCYVALPARLMSQFLALKTFLSPEPTWLDQRVAAEFISSDSFFGHLRRVRQQYKQRRNTMLSSP